MTPLCMLCAAKSDFYKKKVCRIIRKDIQKKLVAQWCQCHRCDMHRGFIDTVVTCTAMSLSPLCTQLFWLSLQIRSHIRKGFNLCITDPGEVVWWNKTEVEISCQGPFKLGTRWCCPAGLLWPYLPGGSQQTFSGVEAGEGSKGRLLSFPAMPVLLTSWILWASRALDSFGASAAPGSFGACKAPGSFGACKALSSFGASEAPVSFAGSSANGSLGDGGVPGSIGAIRAHLWALGAHNGALTPLCNWSSLLSSWSHLRAFHV
jgi:hypothetical protein